MDKCSALAEMGDRLATIDMGRKVGRVAVLLSVGEVGPHTMSPGPRPNSVPSGSLDDASSCSATVDMGRKVEAAVPLSAGGSAGSHLTHSRLGRGLPPYQVAS